MQAAIFAIYSAIIPVSIFASKNENETEIILGIVYFFIFIISSFASRNSHLFEKYFSTELSLKLLWIFFTLSMIMIGIFIWKNNVFMLVVSYVILYIAYNLRNPIIVAKIGELADKKKRATIMSYESQITSVIVIVLAPVIGYISDSLGVENSFLL